MSHLWKTIAVSSFSCLILMVGFWMVEASDYVSRADVSKMIQTESPYLLDRQLVLKSIQDINEALKQNTQVISELNTEIARLRTELDKLP